MLACRRASVWQGGFVKTFAFLWLVFAFAGCATHKSAVSLPPLQLDQPEVRITTGLQAGRWQFPAGEYVAAFRDEQGVYYKPPTPIILRGSPSPEIYLFVANDGRHGAYSEGAAVSLMLKEPLPVR
jgi:hypothetical protein